MIYQDVCANSEYCIPFFVIRMRLSFLGLLGFSSLPNLLLMTEHLTQFFWLNKTI